MRLGNRPLLGNVLERAKRATSLHEVVLATTRLPQDDCIADLGHNYEISVFRGHPTDLVDRYYNAALCFNAEVVVRIPADNPLIHPSEIDRIVEYYLSSGVDFASNIGPFLDNQYPDGLGAEVFSVKLLEMLYKDVKDPRHREHVTTFFREQPLRFKLGTVKCPEAFRRPDIKLDVNTREDYDFLVQMFDQLNQPNKLIDITEIILWYDSKTAK